MASHGPTSGPPGAPRVTRVDLVTPARWDDVRFAAIAIYLAYVSEGDPVPAYYILEGGLATGSPRMIYISPDMNQEIRVSGYQPTPFS